MKKVLFFAASVFSLNAMGQDTKQDTKMDTLSGSNTRQDSVYCAEMKDGLLLLSSKGKPLSKDVTLANGTTVTTTARIKAKDGVESQLNAGQCIDLSSASAATPVKKEKVKPAVVGTK